jgi:hypothetical protein
MALYNFNGCEYIKYEGKIIICIKESFNNLLEGKYKIFFNRMLNINTDDIIILFEKTNKIGKNKNI